MYATCSSEPEENEAVVDAFMVRHVRSSNWWTFTPMEAPRLVALLSERGMLQTLPFAHGLEAFFAAALVTRRLKRLKTRDTDS